VVRPAERAQRICPHSLVIGEMALAIVLLAAAGVMIRSFLNIYNANLGVKTANIVTASVGLPTPTYPRADAQISFFDRLKSRLEAIPGVESIAIANRLPTSGSLKFPYELAGASPVDEPRRPTLSAMIIGPAYFRTLAAEVVTGREFTDADGVSGVQVAMVNRRFASQYWPGEDPLGQRLRLFNGKTPEAWLTVVGVAPNIVQNDITRQTFDPLVYLPYRQKPAAGMWVFARTRVPPESLGTALRREVQALDADLPILGPFTLAERLATWNYWSSGIMAVPFSILRRSRFCSRPPACTRSSRTR
jgi:putative ABC transport system permease protein